ncbi:unnamed protein product [Ectocarpus fasciculatus]
MILMCPFLTRAKAIVLGRSRVPFVVCTVVFVHSSVRGEWISCWSCENFSLSKCQGRHVWLLVASNRIQESSKTESLHHLPRSRLRGRT